MTFVLRVEARALRRWHLQLLERIEGAEGARPGIVIVDSPAPAASGLTTLFAIERRLRRLEASNPLDMLQVEAFARWRPTVGSPKVLLDLAAPDGTAPIAQGGRCWRLRVDGGPVEAGLAAAALGGRAPLVEIVEDGTIVAAGRFGADRSDTALLALSEMLARLSTLVLAALAGGAPQVPALPASPLYEPPSAAPRPAAPRMARKLAAAAAGFGYRRLFLTPHWRVGWRRLDDGPDLFDLRRHPESGWREMPDDGSRFYADPFPILHEGQVTLFVEELPHATGKGVISAVAFGPDGPVGAPRCVLELDTHLSYPFVFARDGEIWMIPENCQAGRVDLYRATAFPGGWVREATLLDGIVASDATLVEHDGRWWMFATVKDGGAFSDSLCLWSAPDFRGPWTAHRRNPVLIDIASARPAGRIVRCGDALFRPVQDCRGGYGRALAIARITRLDDDGFSQEVETILEAGGPLWGGRRLHSLNSAGGFEFIDGSATVRRRLF